MLNPYEFAVKLARHLKSADEFSNIPFNADHAISTLKLPPNTAPDQAYKRMSYLHRNNKFSPAQHEAFNQYYGGQKPINPQNIAPQKPIQVRQPPAPVANTPVPVKPQPQPQPSGQSMAVAPQIPPAM